MHVSTGMAQLSSGSFLAALVFYSLSVLAFAGDFAYGRYLRPGKTAAGGRAPGRSRAPELARAAAAAGGIAGGPEQIMPSAPAAVATDPPAGPPAPPSAVRAFRAVVRAGPWVRAGLALTAAGLAAHLVGVLTRGMAIGRMPLSDMYEYVTALTCVAVLFFLAIMIRYRAWYLGLFVNGAVVAVLGLTETVIYTSAGQVVPALQSYWLTVHVTAMTLATGIFFVAAVMGVVYLFAARHARLVAAGRAVAASGIMGRLPEPEVLDRLAYRTVVFGFPLWTFGLITGAIWAERAWGSYWQWDPVETWAFITWVMYAGFLHARATAGWRGVRAAWIQLAGFACLIVNVIVIQTVITGMHSYAGLS